MELEILSKGLDTLWTLIAAFLVFFMQAGFGMVEAGLIRAKNTANILMKNFMDFCIATLVFYCIGYAFMFGEGNGLIGHTGFFMNHPNNPSTLPLWAFLLFQTVAMQIKNVNLVETIQKGLPHPPEGWVIKIAVISDESQDSFS